VPLVFLIVSPFLVVLNSRLCVGRLCGFETVFELAILIYIGVPSGLVALGRAILRAIRHGDRLSALAFGLITIVAFYAAWALFTLGNAAPFASQALFRVVYNFPPGELPIRPLATDGSYLLMMGAPVRPLATDGSYLLMMGAPATLVVYGLLGGERKRYVGVVALGAMLLLLLILRVTS
jgi:hypothetical protein